MFKFTDEEIAKVKDNLRAIKNYCEQEIVPKLDDRASVMAIFQAGKELPCLHVHGNGSMYLHMGALDIEFTETKDGTCTDYMTLWFLACKILPHWAEVKQRLHTELSQQDELRKGMTDGFRI